MKALLIIFGITLLFIGVIVLAVKSSITELAKGFDVNLSPEDEPEDLAIMRKVEFKNYNDVDEEDLHFMSHISQ